MKVKLNLIFVAFLSIASSCTDKKETIEPVIDPVEKKVIIKNDILDGDYHGKIMINTIVWTGQNQRPDTAYSYPLYFSIKGNQFFRPDCGCNGSIEINKLDSIVEFKSKSTACESGNFRNWIINTFSYKIDSGKISIFRKDPDLKDADLKAKYGAGSGLNITSIYATKTSEFSK